MSNGAKVLMVDACHYDVIVEDIPTVLKFLKECTDWDVGGTGDYIAFTTPSGKEMGIWKLQGWANKQLFFYTVTNLDQFLEQHNITNPDWRGNHPRHNKPGAMFYDEAGVLWGVHEV